MAKIKNDKYYTPKELAEYCVEKTKEIVGVDNISEWLEPSGGSGVFLDFLPKGTYSCDIEPEDSRVDKKDYLSLDLGYREGRCIIGNPPFGRANSGVKKFFKKSTLLGEYIAFILPISQFNNNNELYQYDLIYSEDLGKCLFTDRIIHCCFNIYRKPKLKKQKPVQKLRDLEIVGWRKAKSVDCDFYICCYGSNTGMIVDKDSKLVNINGIIIKNEKLREQIYSVFKTTKWASVYNMTTTPNLLRWQIMKHLKEQIPELE